MLLREFRKFLFGQNFSWKTMKMEKNFKNFANQVFVWSNLALTKFSEHNCTCPHSKKFKYHSKVLTSFTSSLSGNDKYQNFDQRIQWSEIMIVEISFKIQSELNEKFETSSMEISNKVSRVFWRHQLKLLEFLDCYIFMTF